MGKKSSKPKREVGTLPKNLLIVRVLCPCLQTWGARLSATVVLQNPHRWTKLVDICPSVKLFPDDMHSKKEVL
jgi:hypothetical protein